MSETEFVKRQIKREKENRIGRCIRKITRKCKNMLNKKIEEIEDYNSSITQEKHQQYNCFSCNRKGHFNKACPAKAKEEANQSQGHIIGFTEGSRAEENIRRNKDAEKKGKETLEHFGIKLKEKDKVCKNQQEAHYEKDRTYITCYKCKDLGHYAMDCPRKIRNKEHARITSNKASTSKHSINEDTYRGGVVSSVVGKVSNGCGLVWKTVSSVNVGFPGAAFLPK
nr:ARID DNA-binding domain-containing protein [Tanacetum cinerariifolium]